MWRWKDNKRLTVVLYFFLLRDAPHSPAVLIGSGEQPCKGHADVNWVWRTSAAGTNIPASLYPFVHPSSFSFTSTWSKCETLSSVLWFSPFLLPSVRPQFRSKIRFNSCTQNVQHSLHLVASIAITNMDILHVLLLLLSSVRQCGGWSL